MSDFQNEDCTRRCKSKQHGSTITSCLTKRAITDEYLASYIKATCANYPQVYDHEGRLGLHMAASRGRAAVIQWLANHSNESLLNAKDEESGYTPLHRALFYGQIHIAVQLLKIGVNPDILDKDDYKAAEHVMLDRQYIYKHEGNQPCDVYVWGNNTNYTLATGTQQQKKIPDVLNSFSRMNASVTQVCLAKFHSIWLTNSIEGTTVYACGQLARTGAKAATSVKPIPLKLPEACLQAAVLLDATVFLLESGSVLQYSQKNTDSSISQSNTKTPSSIKLPTTKPLIKLSHPLGICASRVHAVVWNKHGVHTWGLNLGQLGHSQPNDKYIDLPKKVSISHKEDTVFQLVAASDAATVATTSRGDVYLIHKHLCKKIAIKQINLKQVCVESKMSENGVYGPVTVLLLTNLGQLMIWQDHVNRLTRCVFGLSHQTTINHITITHDSIYFTTNYGEAYLGKVSNKTKPVSFTPKKEKENGISPLFKFLEKEDCTNVKITRIPNVHRAVSIVADSEGTNFACLQIKPNCGPIGLPKLSPSTMDKEMNSLLETVSLDDGMHDVVFKIGHKTYPAHIYIIATSSDYLNELYNETKSKLPSEKPTIQIDNIDSQVFERVLEFMYSGTCDVVRLGVCGLKIKREMQNKGEDVDIELQSNPEDISAYEVYKQTNVKARRNRKSSTDSPTVYEYHDPVKLVLDAAKKLKVANLQKMLDSFYSHNGVIHSRNKTSTPTHIPTFDRDNLNDKVDAHLRSKDGFVIKAHKCVLAARLEYFNGMFMHSWSESNLSTVPLPINHSVLSPVINFLYTDTCPEVESCESIDFICSLLIVADQLFVSRLKELCEIALANVINLKNCAELCQFAHTFNADQLKQCCMDFIALNLTNILENKSLEVLEAKLLQDISCHYCKVNPIMSARIITPFSNAPSDETIESLAKNNIIDLDVIDADMLKEDLSEKKRKKKDISENERTRKRYESVSSVTSLDLSTETVVSPKSVKEKVDKWIKIPTTQQKVQARLKAVCTAADILKEPQVESFVTLTKSVTDDVNTSISSSPPDFDLARSPTGSLTISHIGPKLSQKQRKKLAQLGTNTSTVIDEPVPSNVPKNPWKVLTPLPSNNRVVVKGPQLNEILADQKKQKDDSSRIMTKPLSLTQLEDKAIKELEKFYNIHEVDDELISVHRIELSITSPQWINSAK